MEGISVDAAIKKGRLQLLWIPMSIMFGVIILMIAALPVMRKGSVWVPICGFGGFFLAISLSSLYYFFMLPRWRIWAFSNVRNVHELKQRALLARIYPKDNSFWWRLEIKSAAQADILRNLADRFLQPDIFEDDYSIPYQTDYSYPKSDKFIFLLLALAALAGAITMFGANQIFPGIIVFASAVLFAVLAYKRFITTEPLLTISNDGITTKENGFHAWSAIQNEQVFWVSAGKASYYGLSYEVNGGTIKMSLKNLTGLRSYKVDHVLRTYRGRYQSWHGQRS